MLYFMLFLPFLFGSLIFCVKKFRSYKVLFPIIISLCIVTICEVVGGLSKTTDIEYHNGFVKVVEYYEPWDEMVPCRHPIYNTRTDSKGNTYTEFAGYQHAFDVDYHPEYWLLTDNTDHYQQISEESFLNIRKKFGNYNFVELNRSYYSIDGNKYISVFDGNEDKLEGCVHTHYYENRVQATNRSIFSFEKITQEEKEKYGLFDYPYINEYKCNSILGYEDQRAERNLEIFNSLNGKPLQIRVWILVYKNQPIESAEKQRSYWQGGNKNELILAVGIDDHNIVKWGYTFSWTESEIVKIKCLDYINDQKDKTIDLNKLVDEIKPVIKESWKRKEFKDFKYLSVSVSPWFYFIGFITMSIVFIVYILKFGVAGR